MALSSAWLSSCFVWTKPAGGVYFMLGSNMEVHFAQVQLITTLSMTKGDEVKRERVGVFVSS